MSLSTSISASSLLLWQLEMDNMCVSNFFVECILQVHRTCRLGKVCIRVPAIQRMNVTAHVMQMLTTCLEAWLQESHCSYGSWLSWCHSWSSIWSATKTWSDSEITYPNLWWSTRISILVLKSKAPSWLLIYASLERRLQQKSLRSKHKLLQTLSDLLYAVNKVALEACKTSACTVLASTTWTAPQVKRDKSSWSNWRLWHKCLKSHLISIASSALLRLGNVFERIRIALFTLLHNAANKFTYHWIQRVHTLAKYAAREKQGMRANSSPQTRTYTCVCTYTFLIRTRCGMPH